MKQHYSDTLRLNFLELSDDFKQTSSDLRADIDAAITDSAKFPASYIKQLRHDIVFECMQRNQVSKPPAGWVSIAKAIAENGKVSTTCYASDIWCGGIRNFLDSTDVPGTVGVVEIALSPSFWSSKWLGEVLRGTLQSRRNDHEQALARLNHAEDCMLMLLPEDKE
jgi:hypothetical protein